MSVFHHTEKKIAFPIALILLLAILISTTFVIQSLKTLNTKANTTTFDEIEVTNISDSTATIIWKTDIKAKGWILFGTNKNTLTTSAFDDRDTTDHKNAFTQHHATLKHLNENSTYYFKIISTQKIHTSTNNAPFYFKTSPLLSLQKGVKPAFGKGINTNGSPLVESLILFKVDDAITLSTLTKTTGEWLIPLFSLINKRTYQPLVFTNTTPVTIEMRNDNNEKATLTTTIGQVSPVSETIVMGQKKKFVEDNTHVLANFTTRTPPQKTVIDILFPKHNAIIAGKRPLIQGTALPFSTVTLRLHSIVSTHTHTLKSTQEGLWSFNLPYNLPEETHTLTLTTHDANNAIVTKTRVFSIAKSGESVLGEATPEAAITQTLPSPSPHPALSSTLTPTYSPSPPVTGNIPLSIPLVGSGLLILGLGFIMLF
ncbi:MAG TPA: fibronectin type III domain-containing protein [Patescibacteria group bacterium]|nr:fibronectin type III domain-containing protein [Patescibacteria group bacterium]